MALEQEVGSSVEGLGHEVVAAVERYQPRSLSEGQLASGFDQLKELVLRCEPRSVSEARGIWASLSRFVADRAGEKVRLSRLLTEVEVFGWLYELSVAGAPGGTISNHRHRLSRCIRVARGLPARLGVRGERSTAVSLPLLVEDRSWLEFWLVEVDAALAAVYVAALGAGLVKSRAVGATVRTDGGGGFVVVDVDGCAHRVVDDLGAVASVAVGSTVADGEWDVLRVWTGKLGVALTRSRVLVTYACLVVGQRGSAADVFRCFHLSERAAVSACSFLERPEPSVVRGLLRG